MNEDYSVDMGLGADHDGAGAAQGLEGVRDDAGHGDYLDSDAISLADAVDTADTVDGDAPDDAARAVSAADARQRAVDRAMGERIYAEREKTQRRLMQEHAPELELARLARQALGDRALDLLGQLALERGVAGSAADGGAGVRGVAEFGASDAGEPVAGALGRVSDGGYDGVEARVTALTREANAILERDGVNMVDVLREDAALRDRVVSGGLDLRTAYGYYLATRAQPEAASRGRVPAAVRGGANSGGVERSIENMSAAEFDRLEQQLTRGARVFLG